jgi:hypothetical protein
MTSYILVQAYEVSEKATASIIRMMDTAGSPETLVHSSQITQNPKDGIITGTGKL